MIMTAEIRVLHVTRLRDTAARGGQGAALTRFNDGVRSGKIQCMRHQANDVASSFRVGQSQSKVTSAAPAVCEGS